jgi:hypothetical protein
MTCPLQDIRVGHAAMKQAGFFTAHKGANSSNLTETKTGEIIMSKKQKTYYVAFCVSQAYKAYFEADSAEHAEKLARESWYEDGDADFKHIEESVDFVEASPID